MTRATSSEGSASSTMSDSASIVPRAHGFSAGPTLHGTSSSGEDWSMQGADDAHVPRVSFIDDVQEAKHHEDHVERHPSADGIPPAPPPATADVPLTLATLGIGIGGACRSPFSSTACPKEPIGNFASDLSSAETSLAFDVDAAVQRCGEMDATSAKANASEPALAPISTSATLQTIQTVFRQPDELTASSPGSPARIATLTSPAMGARPPLPRSPRSRTAALPVRASLVNLAAFVWSAQESLGVPLRAVAAASGIPAVPLPATMGLEAPSAALESLRRALMSSPEDTAYVYDLGHSVRAVAAFRRALPRATPHYAVKCNPTPALVAALAAAGAGFDCASLAEIKLVLSLGVSADRIVYAHPCKPPEQLAEAQRLGVPLTVVDSKAEVAKLARHAPGMPALVRVRADDPAARCSLGTKFGADPVLGTRRIARVAATLGVPLAGVAFHVGSGSQGRGAYAAALAAARVAWLELVEAGHRPTVLDLGGGFPGARIDAASLAAERDRDEAEEDAKAREPEVAADGTVAMDFACAPPSLASLSSLSSSTSSATVSLDASPRLLNPAPLEEASAALDELFPAALHPSLRVLAEPGRFFAEPAAAFAARVIGVRECRDHLRGQDVFLADGVYGSLNNLIYDHIALPAPVVIRDPTQPHTGADDVPLSTTLFGPTCDGIDVLARDAKLPPLRVGDWLAFDRWGAYTIAGAVDFNGFAVSKPDVRLCWGISDR